MEFFPNAKRPRGEPEFRAASDFPLPNLSAEPGETGLVVSFTKDWTYSTESPEQHAGRFGCLRVLQDNGLSILTGEERPNCSVNEHKDRGKYWFEARESADGMKNIFIRCGRNAASKNCIMTGLLANGWESEIILPVSHLDRWDEAAQTAQRYFAKYIIDCGRK